MVNGSLCHRLLGKQTGLTPDAPYLDPCLPLDIKDEIQQNGQTLYLRGTGDFDLCRETLQPFMNKTNETQTSLNGVYQPPIHFQNSEFYGFSEFYYCTEDVLRMGGDYNAAKFTKAAKVTSQENPCCIETIGLQGGKGGCSASLRYLFPSIVGGKSSEDLSSTSHIVYQE